MGGGEFRLRDRQFLSATAGQGGSLPATTIGHWTASRRRQPRPDRVPATKSVDYQAKNAEMAWEAPAR
jgi:hypothetical protein